MDVEMAERKRRSIRLYAKTPVPAQTLYALTDVGRLYASAGNLQPVGFAIVQKEEHRDAVFESVNWAMYLEDFEVGPPFRPPSYLLLLAEGHSTASFAFDAGGAAANIMLAATAHGLSTCCLGIARPEPLRKKLALPEPWRPAYAIAVGYGAHKSTVVPFNGSVKYRQDENSDFYVPKKSLKDVLIFTDTVCETIINQ